MTAPALGTHLISFIWALSLLVCFQASGRLALKGLNIQSDSFLFELSAGMGLFSILFLALGSIGLLKPTPLKIILVIWGMLSLPIIFKTRPKFYFPSSTDPSIIAGAVMSILGLAASFPYSLGPEIFHDALSYHLSLPKLSLLQGTLAAEPRNLLAGMPSLPQTLFGWSLAADPSGGAARILHWFFLPLTAAAAYQLARLISSPGAAALSAGLVFSAPALLSESYRVSAGLEWAFFELLSFHAFLQARASFEKSARRNSFLLCGICLGLAMSCKYPAWILPLAFFAAGRGLSSKELTAVLAPAAALVLPWILRNTIQYQNPLFPYFHDWLYPALKHPPDWRMFSEQSWHWGTMLSSGKGLGSLLKFPISSAEGFGPFLFGLAPLFFSRLGPEASLLRRLVLASLLPLALMASLPRYLIAHLPGAFVLLAIALDALTPQKLRRAALCAVAAIFLLGWSVFVSKQPYQSHIPAITGQQSLSEFLGHSRGDYPNPPYAAFEFLNKTAPRNDRVLLVGDSRGFHLDRAYYHSTFESPSYLELWANESETDEIFLGEFEKRGIRWIVFNLAEMSRLGKELKLNPEGTRRIDAVLFPRIEKVFEAADLKDRQVLVFKFIPSSPPPS